MQNLIGFPPASLSAIASVLPSGCSHLPVLPQNKPIPSLLRGSSHCLSLVSRIHVSSWFWSFSRVDIWRREPAAWGLM